MLRFNNCLALLIRQSYNRCTRKILVLDDTATQIASRTDTAQGFMAGKSLLRNLFL